jgi:hypothetical protein
MRRRRSRFRYVDAEPVARPERLTLAQLRALGDAARDDYDKTRHDWHPNVPFIQTPQLTALHEGIDDIVNSNPSGPDKMRSVAAIDALPGLGKSTIATTYARDFDRAEIRRHGPLTDAGQERIPELNADRLTSYALDSGFLRTPAPPRLVPGDPLFLLFYPPAW